jgi:hypothetical protein
MRSRDAWWDTDKWEAHNALPTYIDAILQLGSRRFTDYIRFAGLYGNWDAAPATGSFLASGVPMGRAYRRASFNLTQNMVDSVANKRTSEYSRILANSVDGDYKQFMLAKLLTKALRNEFKTQNVEEKFFSVVKDALVFGNGLWTVHKKGGGKTGAPAKPEIARQFSPEIVVDPYENLTDGWPNSFAVCRFVSRAALAARYPQHAEIIMRAPTEPGHYIRVRGDDNIRVDEAWYGAKAGRVGRYVSCVTGVTLEDNDYEHAEPPFVNIAWNPPFQGWYGQGLVDQLMGLQMKVNELIEIISEAHTLFAHPYMAIEQNSNVNLAHIQDVPGRMIKYLTTKPEIMAAQMISPEVYTWLETCYRKAYEIAGINPVIAGAKQLQRVESSKAQRSMQQMDDQRHQSFASRCEQSTEKLAKLFCRVAAECDEENGYSTKMPSSVHMVSIPWKKIAYNVDTYQIEIGQVNPMMAKTSDKLQDLQDMQGLSQLTPTQFRQYLDNPDVQRAARLATASDDYIDWAIDQMTMEDKPMVVDEFVDKLTAFKVCVEHWLVAERLGWHSDVARENLLSYMLMLKDSIAAMGPMAGPGQSAAQPGAPGAPTPNMAAGLAPPVQNTNNISVNSPDTQQSGQ